MKINKLFFIAVLGIGAGVLSVIIYNETPKPQAPVAVTSNPYDNGIYATGIVESYQHNGSNINIYPEVAGRVTKVYVQEGQTIKKGQSILKIYDEIQRKLVAKDMAQINYQQANLKELTAQWNKIHQAYNLNPHAVSLNDYDNAQYSVKIAQESLNASIAQYEADDALLKEYTVKAPIDGQILRIISAQGDYVSPQGVFDTYTEAFQPTVQMGVVNPKLEVRVYLDEILIPKLPDGDHLQATMFIRGMNNKSIPLVFVNIQPYAIPNIELSNERTQRVDVRVLPLIFRFEKPTDIKIYPGQLVDVYLKGKK